MSLHEDYHFYADEIGFAEIATSSFDNNVWLIDQRDFSLKKYNIDSKRITSTTPLDLLLSNQSHQLLYCLEYQNRLFISTKDAGILIFDTLGNYLKTYPVSNAVHFDFWQDEIYYLDGDLLMRRNLYSDAVVARTLPHGNWKFAIINHDLLYLFTDKNIFLYK
ncbi:MAG: hypothetical protein HC819_05570 [Cyclobacteriaceae bacterium]|nr:hypothetical protein [Cyclobacteriaceae bacterium]